MIFPSLMDTKIIWFQEFQSSLVWKWCYWSLWTRRNTTRAWSLNSREQFSHCLSKVNTDSLCQDIISSDLYLTPADSLSDHVAQYNSTLAALLDSHAPIKSKTITERTDSKYYTSELGCLKREARQLERKSNASKLTQVVNVIDGAFRNGYFSAIYTLEDSSILTIIILVIIYFMVWMNHQDIPLSNELYIFVVTMTTVAMVTMATVVMVTTKMQSSFESGISWWFIHTTNYMTTRIIIVRILGSSRVYTAEKYPFLNAPSITLTTWEEDKQIPRDWHFWGIMA